MKEELRHKMEVEKDGRIYVLDIPGNAPLGEAYDACHEFLAKIVDLAQAAAEKVKRQESQANGDKKEAGDAK